MRTTGAHRGKPAVSGRLVAVLTALVVGCVAVVLAVSAGGRATHGAAAAAAERGRPAAAKADADPGKMTDARPARLAVAAPERPQAARLPSGRRVPVRAVATTRDGTLDVPGDIAVAGWWRGGSRIGDPFGSTLLAAHVDSTTQGLGPYAELLTVKRGQRVVLTSAHLTQTFSITSLRLLPKKDLPSAKWIYSPRGARRLVMVTCAGPYVRARGGYQRLAVVTARPVGPPARRSA